MYESILRYRLSRYPGAGRDFDLPGGSQDSVDHLLKFYPGVYSHALHKTNVPRYGGRLRLLLGNPIPSLTDMAQELFADVESFGKKSLRMSDMELLASVLARGEVNGSYGRTYWGNDADTFHLLTCNIDWNSYYGVRDESWSEFVSTFDDDRRVRMISASLRCCCIEQAEIQVGLEPPSIATLLAALGSGSLERLFEV